MITPQCINATETSEKAQKEKKKSWQNQEKNQKNSISATVVNTTDTLRQRPKKSK